MKQFMLVTITLIGLLSFSQKSNAQDLCSTNKNYCKLLSDTAGTRMMLVTLPLGAKLKTHTHPIHMGYIIKGGLYKWTMINGKTESAQMKAGGNFLSGEEPPHYSWNAGNTTIQFILVER